MQCPHAVNEAYVSVGLEANVDKKNCDFSLSRSIWRHSSLCSEMFIRFGFFFSSQHSQSVIVVLAWVKHAHNTLIPNRCMHLCYFFIRSKFYRIYTWKLIDYWRFVCFFLNDVCVCLWIFKVKYIKFLLSMCLSCLTKVSLNDTLATKIQIPSLSLPFFSTCMKKVVNTQARLNQWLFTFYFKLPEKKTLHDYLIRIGTALWSKMSKKAKHIKRKGWAIAFRFRWG